MTKDLHALIRQAYDRYDSDEYSDLIAKINQHGGREEFDAASSLCLSDDFKERVIGANILGELGWAKDLFHSESVDILIKLLSDKIDDVVLTAAYALGKRANEKSALYLLRLIDHPNASIREGVAYSLGSLENDEVIVGLITLSRDENCDVRNWATFGLGSQCETDSKEIREALKARLSDDIEIRGEAILGLVKRGDKTLADRILLELQSSELDWSIIEAAGLAGGADHKAALLSLKDKLKDDEVDYYGYDIDLAISQLS